jgi:hypothetical protein
VSLAQAVFERWLADPRLTKLVPPGHVFTGRAAGDVQLPYGVILVSVAAGALHTTHVAVQNMRVELAAWFEESAPASRLLEEWRRNFHRQSFSNGDQRCLLMQSVDERVVPEDSRGWKAVAVYSALYERPAADSA